jgi:hypothetical protein
VDLPPPVALRSDSGSRPPFTGLRVHTQDTPHSVGLLWTQRSLPDNTQHSQERNIHGPTGNRTRNPSKLAAADPRLRQRGHWDRPVDEEAK